MHEELLKKNDEGFRFKLPGSMKTKCQEEAHKQGISLATFVRSALVRHLEEIELYRVKAQPDLKERRIDGKTLDRSGYKHA